jgi:hypothetical protein
MLHARRLSHWLCRPIIKSADDPPALLAKRALNTTFIRASYDALVNWPAPQNGNQVRIESKFLGKIGPASMARSCQTAIVCFC